jgi:hypothetical protein
MFGLSGSGAMMGPASGAFDPPLPPLDAEEPPKFRPPALPDPVVPAFPAPPFAPLPLFPVLALAPLAVLPSFVAPPDAFCAPPAPVAAPLPASPGAWLESDELHAMTIPTLARTDVIRERTVTVGFMVDKCSRVHDTRDTARVVRLNAPQQTHIATARDRMPE